MGLIGNYTLPFIPHLKLVPVNESINTIYIYVHRECDLSTVSNIAKNTKE